MLFQPDNVTGNICRLHRVSSDVRASSRLSGNSVFAFYFLHQPPFQDGSCEPALHSETPPSREFEMEWKWEYNYIVTCKASPQLKSRVGFTICTLEPSSADDSGAWPPGRCCASCRAGRQAHLAPGHWVTRSLRMTSAYSLSRMAVDSLDLSPGNGGDVACPSPPLPTLWGVGCQQSGMGGDNNSISLYLHLKLCLKWIW